MTDHFTSFTVTEGPVPSPSTSTLYTLAHPIVGGAVVGFYSWVNTNHHRIRYAHFHTIFFDGSRWEVTAS